MRLIPSRRHIRPKAQSQSPNSHRQTTDTAISISPPTNAKTIWQETQKKIKNDGILRTGPGYRRSMMLADYLMLWTVIFFCDLKFGKTQKNYVPKWSPTATWLISSDARLPDPRYGSKRSNSESDSKDPRMIRASLSGRWKFLPGSLPVYAHEDKFVNGLLRTRTEWRNRAHRNTLLENHTAQSLQQNARDDPQDMYWGPWGLFLHFKFSRQRRISSVASPCDSIEIGLDAMSIHS